MTQRRSQKRESEASILLYQHLREVGGPHYAIEKEYRFHCARKWRFDFALTFPKIAIEIEGGVWVTGGGGHNRSQAFLDDMEKYNWAGAFGWKVLRFTPKQVLDGTAIEFIKRVLESSDAGGLPQVWPSKAREGANL